MYTTGSKYFHYRLQRNFHRLLKILIEFVFVSGSTPPQWSGAQGDPNRFTNMGRPRIRAATKLRDFFHVQIRWHMGSRSNWADFVEILQCKTMRLFSMAHRVTFELGGKFCFVGIMRPFNFGSIAYPMLNYKNYPPPFV